MALPLIVAGYPACKHIQRKKTDITVSEDMLKAMIEEANVYPLFEEKIYQYKVIKSSSLQTNELLKCRWEQFLKTLREKTPFIFPSYYDLHFNKYLVKYDPSQSIRNRATYRFHLKVGPGVDKFGQRPIPDDMHLRKTEMEKIIKKESEDHQKVDKKKDLS